MNFFPFASFVAEKIVSGVNTVFAPETIFSATKEQFLALTGSILHIHGVGRRRRRTAPSSGPPLPQWPRLAWGLQRVQEGKEEVQGLQARRFQSAAQPSPAAEGETQIPNRLEVHAFFRTPRPEGHQNKPARARGEAQRACPPRRLPQACRSRAPGCILARAPAETCNGTTILSASNARPPPASLTTSLPTHARPPRTPSTQTFTARARVGSTPLPQTRTTPTMRRCAQPTRWPPSTHNIARA